MRKIGLKSDGKVMQLCEKLLFMLKVINSITKEASMRAILLIITYNQQENEYLKWMPDEGETWNTFIFVFLGSDLVQNTNFGIWI